MRKIAAGNWKMHGSRLQLDHIKALAERHKEAACDIIICPPAPFVSLARDYAGPLEIGAQDCHSDKKGAYTGDISAQMLAELGATHVIVGHSERRTGHGESNATVCAKARAAQKAGLIPIICIGETLEERKAGAAQHVIKEQLDDSLPEASDSTPFVVAYEPVWAIGTGMVPRLEEIDEIHQLCRSELRRSHPMLADETPLLYGGSVKGSNAAEIFSVADVDGALVGGASLKAEDFSPIIEALEQS